MEFVAVVPVTDVAIEAANIGFSEEAITFVVYAFHGTIDRPILDLVAPLYRALGATERTAHRIPLNAMVVEAIFHLNRDGAAKCVKAKGRIVRHHGDRLDRGRRDQVPVDGVAERFIDTTPVLIDRQS